MKRLHGHHYIVCTEVVFVSHSLEIKTFASEFEVVNVLWIREGTDDIVTIICM